MKSVIPIPIHCNSKFLASLYDRQLYVVLVHEGREILKILNGRHDRDRLFVLGYQDDGVCTKDVDIVQLSVSDIKTVGSHHMIDANNPVTVFSFEI